MGQAVSVIRSPLTEEKLLHSTSFHVRFVVNKVALGQVYPQVLQFATASNIPVMFHIHLHLHTALTTKTNGRSLGTLQKAMLFPKSGSTGLA